MPLQQSLTVLAALIDASIADLSPVAWCSLTRRSLGRIIAAKGVVADLERAAAEEAAERDAYCDMAEREAEMEPAPF
jgi:hypothetical protein